MGRFIDPDNSLLAHRSRADHIVGLALFVLVIFVSIVSSLEAALVVAVTFGVLAGLIQEKWSSRKDPRLWVLVAVVATIQISTIFLIRIPRVTTGFVAIPLMVVEGLALLGLFNWIERRFPRPVDAAQSEGSAPQTGAVSFSDGIARGEQAIEDGRVVPHAEARSRMARWLK